MKTNIEDVLLKAKIDLMTKSVFLASICFDLKHKFTEEVPTAATNGFEVFYNKKFMETLSFDGVVFVLAHELWHVGMNHIGRVGDRDKNIYYIAADHVVNLLLKEHGYEVLSFALCDQRFTGMSTDQVYDILKDEIPECIGPLGGTFAPGSKQSGEPKENEDPIGNDLLEPPPGKTESEIQSKIEQTIIKAIDANNSSVDPGQLPGELERMVKEILEPKINWNVLLANYLNDMVEEDSSWSQLNRRYLPALLPSERTEGLSNVVIAYDTSGSVNDDDIMEMSSEVEGMRQQFQMDYVTIIDCDTKIHNITKLEKNDSILDVKIEGGGGTLCKPVLDYCDDKNISVLIYFSDLHIFDIPTEERGFPIIWVATEKTNTVMPIGRTIYIK